MAAAIIDTAVFAELQETAGADFVVELVDTFIVEAPQMLAELRSAQQAASAERFRRAAHSLKSNGATFGASRRTEMARALELGGLTGDAAPIDAIEAEFVRVAAALKELCNG
jgi:HPt (histidine-containing phosphotransfer) domain-containing protein